METIARNASKKLKATIKMDQKWSEISKIDQLQGVFIAFILLVLYTL